MSEERKPNSGQPKVSRRSFLASTAAAGAAVTLPSNSLLNNIAPTFAEQFGITPEIAKYFSWLVQVDKAKDAIALFKDETVDYDQKLEKARIMGERLEGDYNASEIYDRWNAVSNQGAKKDTPVKTLWNVTMHIRTHFFR